MSRANTAVTVRPLVAIHNGIHGLVTAGPSSHALIGRERRDRIRAAWLNVGWSREWEPLIQVAAPSGSVHDLAVVAAILLVLDPDLPVPAADAIRFVGEVRLDGGVTDGVVTLPARNEAVLVTRIDQLPGLIWKAAQA